MRACWNPLKRVLYSRAATPMSMGRVLGVGNHNIEDVMGGLFLDGEIWIGRGNFTEAVHIVFRKDEEASHQNLTGNHLRYVVFDTPTAAPSSSLKKLHFEERFSLLLKCLKADNFFILPTIRLKCTDSQHMLSYSKMIFESGGEGVILRKYASAYENGRSHALLKYKAIRDAEALVTGKRGIYVTCKMPDGREFVGVQKMRGEVEIGDVVSYGFTSLCSNGMPRNPTILRKRDDLIREDIVNTENKENVVNYL